METLIEFRLEANLPNSFCQNQSTRCRISAYSKKFECIKSAYEVTDIRLKAIHISKDIDATSIGKREVGRLGGRGRGGLGEGVGGFIDAEPTAFFPPRFSYSTTVHHGCRIILTVLYIG